MKWDGGYDNNRYEIGNDLRLNTELVISDMGIKSISENVSIIKWIYSDINGKTKNTNYNNSVQ